MQSYQDLIAMNLRKLRPPFGFDYILLTHWLPVLSPWRIKSSVVSNTVYIALERIAT